MALKDFLGLAGDFLGSTFSTIGGVITNRQNAKENQKNREWNEKMWNLTNEYNLPTNQMGRLRGAGLNPNLVYGDGTSSLASYAGNLGTQKAYENPAQNVKLNIADAVRLNNESKVAESQANLNNQEAEKSRQEAQRLEEENKVMPERMKKEIEILGYESSMKNIDEFVKQQTYNNEIERIYQEAEQSILSTEISRANKRIVIQQLSNLAEEYNNLQKQGKVIEAEELLKKAQIKTEQSQQSLNYANAIAAKAKANYDNAMAKLAPAQQALLRQQVHKEAALAVYYGSQSNLTHQQADKIANDIEIAIMSGNVENYKKLTERYGTGVVSSVANRLMDAAQNPDFGKAFVKKTSSPYFQNSRKR